MLQVGSYLVVKTDDTRTCTTAIANSLALDLGVEKISLG